VPEYQTEDIRELIEKPYRIIYRIKSNRRFSGHPWRTFSARGDLTTIEQRAEAPALEEQVLRSLRSQPV
jgi:hypothetical protein